MEFSVNPVEKNKGVKGSFLLQELETESSLFETVLWQLPAGVIIVELSSGKILLTNEQAKRITGYTSESSVEIKRYSGLQSLKVLRPDGRIYQLEDWPVWRALYTGEVVGEEVELLRNNGSRVMIQANSSPIYNQAGEIMAGVLTLVDVTEQKQGGLVQYLLAGTQQRIANRLTRLQTVTAALAGALTPTEVAMIMLLEGFSALEVKGSLVAILTVDQSELEIVGATGYPVELIDQWRRFPVSGATPIAAAARLNQPIFLDAREMDQHLSLDLVPNFLFNHQAWAALPLLVKGQKLGAIFLSLDRPHRFNSEEREFMLALANQCAQALERARLYQEAQRLNAELEQRVLERTAELQAANQQLASEIVKWQRSEARFVTIFHTNPTPIAVSTLAEGRFLDVNDSFLEWLGYGHEEVIGSTVTELGFFTDPTFRSKLVQMLQARGNVSQLENSYYTKTREVRTAIVSAELIELEGELCILNVYYDITERKQLVAELAEMQHRLIESREEERLELAQELHDGPVQELYGLTYYLSDLAYVLSGETELAGLKSAQTTLQQVIQALRSTASELRPPTLIPFGLEKAIRSHAEAFQAAHPEMELALALMPDGQRLPEQVRFALFRIYQQALNNITHHAAAQHVFIRFKLEIGGAILEIQDDGQGFEVPQRWISLARQGHLGLVGMSERAEAVGGRLEVSSNPGAGTLIRAVVPRTERLLTYTQ